MCQMIHDLDIAWWLSEEEYEEGAKCPYCGAELDHDKENEIYLCICRLEGHYRDEYVDIRDDAVVCICGNHTHSRGFYPCDAKGNEVEPLIKSAWADAPLWCCDNCGRIISEIFNQVIGDRKDGYTYL